MNEMLRSLSVKVTVRSFGCEVHLDLPWLFSLFAASLFESIPSLGFKNLLLNQPEQHLSRYERNQSLS